MMTWWPVIALGGTWAVIIIFWSGYWYAEWLAKRENKPMTVKNPPPVVVIPESVRKPKPTPIKLPRKPKPGR